MLYFLFQRLAALSQSLKSLGGDLDEEEAQIDEFPSSEVTQAFRFMVGPGHCPMISKYGLSLSRAVGPVDPSFFVV